MLGHLLVILSVVLGLGLADLLAGTRRLVLAHLSHGARLHPVPLLWAIHAFLYVVQVWWGWFGVLERVEELTFFGYLVFLFRSTLIYLVASAALPDKHPDQVLDLGDYYRRVARSYFSLIAVAAASGILHYMLLGQEMFASQQTARWIALLLVVLAASTRSVVVHGVVSAILVINYFVYIIRFSLYAN